MTWLRTDDQTGQHVKIRGLIDDGATGKRALRQRRETIGHWMEILWWCSSSRTDGFVTAEVVDAPGSEQTARRLLRARYGRQPLLHQRAADGSLPSCRCLEGRTWPDGYDYAVHDFLEYNPSRDENDVHKAKKRELRDATLKRAVRDRDQDRCRYCGKHCRFSDRVSDDGLTFDHVDPRIANGMDNLVVACRGCNNKKGRRTPHEAGMPDPRPVPDPQPTHDQPTTRPATVTGPDPGPVPSPDTGPGTGLSQDQEQDAARSQDHISPGGDGDGSAAQGTTQPSALRSQIGPPSTPRRPGFPSPYGRQPTPHPDHHAGHPPQKAETPT